MKKLIVLISVIALLFSINVQAQKIDYVKDFDFLYKTIVNNSVTFKIYCEETGLDSVQFYNSLKEELTADNSMKKFAEVSEKLFNASADMHNGFISKGFFDETYNYLPEKEQDAVLKYVDTTHLKQGNDNYLNHRSTLRGQKTKLRAIHTMFIDGKYYISNNLIINGQKILAGTKIVSVDNIPTGQFYKQNQLNWFPYFDQPSNTFYASQLFWSNEIQHNPHTVKLKLTDNTTFEFNTLETTSVKQIKYPFMMIGSKHKLKYFKKEKALYIRYWAFDNQDPHLKKLEKYKNKPLERVIIDVRRNGGGSDLQWLRGIAWIRANIKLKDQPKTTILKTSAANEYFSQSDIIKSVGKERFNVYKNDILDFIYPSKEKLNELDPQTRQFLEQNKPRLEFNGDIYCLVDNISFSASLSFASLQNYLSNFHVVGDNIPFYGGMGLTPIMFMLPESKMLFRLSATFDYNMYTNKEYRIEPEIKINQTLEDRINWYNKRIRNLNSKKYRLQKSKYFKAIESINQ